MSLYIYISTAAIMPVRSNWIVPVWTEWATYITVGHIIIVLFYYAVDDPHSSSIMWSGDSASIRGPRIWSTCILTGTDPEKTHIAIGTERKAKEHTVRFYPSIKRHEQRLLNAHRDFESVGICFPGMARHNTVQKHLLNLKQQRATNGQRMMMSRKSDTSLGAVNTL